MHRPFTVFIAALALIIGVILSAKHAKQPTQAASVSPALASTMREPPDAPVAREPLSAAEMQTTYPLPFSISHLNESAIRPPISAETFHSAMRPYGAEKRPYTPNSDRRIAALTRTLMQGIALDERSSALYALYDLGEPFASQAVGLALGDASPRLRLEAMEVAALIGPSAAHLLGQVVFGETEPELRAEAVRRLAALGDEASLALVRAALEDSEDVVWLEAETALGAASFHGLGHSAQSATRPIMNEETERILAVDDPASRIAALHALDRFDDETRMEIMGEVTRLDVDERVREEAVIQMARLGGTRVQGLLESALADQSPDVRMQSLRALWGVGSHTIPVLGQVMFSDPDPVIRLEAARLLASDGGQAALALLVAGAEDPDETVSEGVRLLLKRL